MIRDIYTQVSKRPDTLCNFLEGTYVTGQLYYYSLVRESVCGGCATLTTSFMWMQRAVLG